MTKPKLPALIRLFILLIAALLAACSSGGGGGSSGGVTLLSISVTPVTASIANGVSKQFSALGTYSDGTSKDITATVTWSSDKISISTVSANGLVTGVAAGSAVITATSGQISGNTTLTVTSAVLQSIAVTPVNPAIPKGQVRQMLATGTYSDGTSQDISATVTWSSDTPATATVTAAGLASGVATGGAVISATSGAMSGSTTLTVTAAVLQSIAVTPGSPIIPKGLLQQMVATGTYSDGTSQDISATVTWNSDTTATATINTAGLVTGVAAGSTTLTATSGVISGSTILNVSTAVLQSIAVTPISPSIPKGLLQHMVATATYSDNTRQDVTAAVTWSSSNTAVATVNSGNTNGVDIGVATITASSGAISGSATLHVTAAVLQFIAVTPTSPAIPLGLTKQLVATGKYSDDSSQNITSSVTWTSATTPVATINAAGLATSVAGGSSLITAAVGSISGSTTLSVTSAVLQSITVTPANPVVGRYLTRQLTATGTYTDATSQDITALATWTSDTTSVATVNTGGLASAVAVGAATITTTLGATSGNTLLTVVDPTYTIGGTVYGLTLGKTITLQKNGTENLTVSADGVFIFTTQQNNQTAYSATLLTLPTDQPCTITYASGTVAGANVNNISVICSPSIAGSAGLFVAAAPMNAAREAHTATLLADGRVLVAGGLAATGGAIATAELHNPVSGLWTVTGSMTANRAYHTATLLQDGKVLVAGGVNLAGIPVATSELYDPAAGTWSVTKTGATQQTVMTSPRANHTATLLPNGKVLVAGGYQSGLDLALNTSELYDPVTQTWTATSGGMAPRKSHSATLLPNGKVLLVGGSNGYGYLSSIDIYNPSIGSNGSWLTNTPDTSTIIAYHTATLLPDGKVLVTGGTTIDQQFQSRTTAELYDPESGINGSWTVLSNSMNIARSHHDATLLANGKVLVSGGFDGVAFLKSAELYDPATGNWSLTGDLPNLVAYHSSTLLQNGKVLVTGGGLSETSGVNSASLYW